jgi:isopropylmalate/homocitrate/citramalate synthase
MKNLINICDVTLRDGIQNFKSHKPIFSPFLKLHIMNRLKQSNIHNIEIGANVSKKIIEMSNTKNVCESLDLFDVPNLYVLIPNYKKYREFIEWEKFDKVNSLSLLTSCSETFIMKNIKMTFENSLEQINKIINETSKDVRIYVSSSFGCPYEGNINKYHIHNLIKIFKLYNNNPKVKEIVICDTIGTYNMKLLNDYVHTFGPTGKLSLHLHINNNDQNIYEIIYKYKYDIKNIDTSLGNIGGLPTNIFKTKNNISTLKVASIINEMENKEIYNLKSIFELEHLIDKNKI